MKLNRYAALLSAFILSFTMYLMPLLHVHAGWLTLGSVLSGLDEFSGLSIAWIGMALVLHGLAFLLIFWVLVRFDWKRLLVLVAATPFFFIVANLSLLYAIPLLFLVERDTTPEVGALELVCSVPNAAISQVRSGSDLGQVRAGEAWLTDSTQRTRALLRMPGCLKIDLDAPVAGSTIDAVAPGGHLLHRSDNGELFHFSPETETSAPLTTPQGVRFWNPILSDDGLMLVWLERERAQDGSGGHRLRTREIATGRENSIELDLPGRDQFELIGARSLDGPFTLARFRNAIFSVNLRGEIVRGPISPDGVYDARWGFLWVGDGWVAWDGYREEGRARIVWDLPDGQGEVTIPRGRGIDSLSVAQDGSIIAASISSNVTIGNLQSAVVLFQTQDGVEIYRRHQPVFTRTNLAFLGEYFAASWFEDNQSFVDVYRIPTRGE